MDTSVKIGKLTLKNPVMVASGTFGLEYVGMLDINSLGAIITKTITLKPRVGNRPPRVIETASGMLNSIGLENKGLADFITDKIPRISKLKVPLVVSIAADTVDEFRELTKRLDAIDRVNALEVNLSCPNVRHGSREGLCSQEDKVVHEIISAIRAVTKLTTIAKLTPAVTDIVKIALAAEDAGADAVTVANTYMGMAVDIDTRRPKLGNVTGGLSGPAIKPLTQRLVWQTFGKINIPIISSGGIMDHKDAVEYIICGAAAVQIGTASFINPATPGEIIKGIEKYLKEKNIKSVKELTGSLRR